MDIDLGPDLKSRVITAPEFGDFIRALPPSPIVSLLFKGSVLACCDEVVGLFLKDRIIGIASIAPKGEDRQSDPAIQALYMHPDFRKQGYGKMLGKAVFARCIQRGFTNVCADVLASGIINIIKHAPGHFTDDELKKLNVNFIAPKSDFVVEKLTEKETNKEEMKDTFDYFSKH